MNILKFNSEFQKKELADGKDTYTFILSTNKIDRDYDQINIKGMDLSGFMKNPQLLFKHDSYGDVFPVGQWIRLWFENDILGNDLLLGTCYFHELDDVSQKIKLFVDNDIIKATSIGFRELICKNIPPPENMTEEIKQNKYNGMINFIEKSELYEASIVIIPANKDAIRIKSFMEKSIDEIKSEIENNNIEIGKEMGMEIKSGARLSNQTIKCLTNIKEKCAGHKSITDSIKKQCATHKALSDDILSVIDELIDNVVGEPVMEDEPMMNESTDAGKSLEELTITVKELNDEVTNLKSKIEDLQTLKINKSKQQNYETLKQIIN